MATTAFVQATTEVSILEKAINLLREITKVSARHADAVEIGARGL